MAFLKRNIFVIVCVLVCLAGGALGFMACSSYETIEKSMAKAVEIGNALNGAGKVPVHTEPVAPIDLTVQQINVETVQSKVNLVRDKAMEVNQVGLDYMYPDAFPDPTGKPGLNIQFIRAYNEAREALPEILKAKGPPTQEDINAMQALIDAENKELGIETGSSVSAKPSAASPASERSSRPGSGLAEALRGARGSRPRPARTAEPQEGEQPAKPISEAERLRTDARRRAELARAQSIQCYIANDPSQSLTVVGAVLDPRAEPNPIAMWHAQMTIWVQREILAALADVNADAAEKLKQADPDAAVDVTTLPVKRLIKLTVGDYRTAGVEQEEETGRGSRRGGRGGRSAAPAAAPPGGGLGAALRNRSSMTPDRAEDKKEVSTGLSLDLAGQTWTGRTGGGDVDVVPVGLHLIIDQRYLPQVVDRICRKNFYVPTSVSYRRFEPSGQDGYVYGAAPLIEATLTFERCFFPKVYAEKMPLVVHARLGHPIMDEEEEEGRGSRGRGRRSRRR